MLAAESTPAQSKAAVDQDRIRYNEAGAIVLQMQRKVYLVSLPNWVRMHRS